MPAKKKPAKKKSVKKKPAKKTTKAGSKRPSTAAKTKAAKKPAKKKPASKKPASPKKSGAEGKRKPIQTRTKRARRRRAAMEAKDTVLTRAEQAIMERMAELDPADPRYKVLESALAFKASWVILGEHLSDVHMNQRFRTWGFGSFARYCTDEIQITTTTAKKLVRSFQWLGDEAPELIPRASGGYLQEVKRPVPDFNSLSVLYDARNELHNDRVPEDAYLALKQAALEGDRTASQLRRDLKEAIPEELRLQPVDPVRSLRKALNAAARCVESLRDWDGSDELLIQAEELRAAIAHHVPRKADGSAPAEAGAGAAA